MTLFFAQVTVLQHCLSNQNYLLRCFGVEEKSSKEIIETYKNIKTIKDVSNSNSDEITENIDQEKNRQILIKKIRERERKKSSLLR
jgi:galactokinase